MATFFIMKNIPGQKPVKLGKLCAPNTLLALPKAYQELNITDIHEKRSIYVERVSRTMQIEMNLRLNNNKSK